MRMESKRILIVDDSADDIHFVMEHFSDDYAVLAATSGQKALQLAAKDPQPDVILMDVEMPEMNGYETCRQLKSDEETRNIDVIFITSHDTTEEKLAGYDAGGSDYLIKPVQPDELLQKVKISIENKAQHESINQEKATVMNTAMTAITSLGELGVIIEFMRDSFSVKSPESLAQLVVDATSQYGLESTVQLSMLNLQTYASSKNPIPPLELELLTRVQADTRILEKGNRLILNFGNSTQIIKNMPHDDDKRGRLRDHLAILNEGADVRLKALTMQTELEDMVHYSQQAMVDINKMQQDQKHQAIAIMDETKANIETAFLTYGLTESQENKLLEFLRMGEEKSLENLEQGLRIDEQMSAIIQRLEKFSS